MKNTFPQLAKLTRPRLHDAVPRERLFNTLDVLRERPGLCVVGPPGAGKTTLIASYLESRDLPGIWYQVDEGDADVATFFHYLGEAAKRYSDKRHRPLPALTAEYLQDIVGFTRRFFRELFSRLPRPAILVLDNYQEVEANSKFHQVVATAVAEVPDGITLVAVSRADPPTQYARFIANKSVALVVWDELRLTLEEARAIVATRKELDQKAVNALYQQSGGWAAGLAGC